MKYAIFDIETTGGNAENGKITELSLFVHDGEKVVDELTTLLNPEMDIPPFVSSLTGITNKMVAKSPKFYEIAKQLVEMTQDCVLVAHNSEFDYSFLKEEFSRLGYKYRRNTICTVEMARELLPGHASYSLGKLSADLGIKVKGRHRARGDAMATVSLFERILDHPDFEQTLEALLDYDLYDVRTHGHLPKQLIDELPESTGVYFLRNKEESLIYVGKSKNIRKRIMQHLSNDRRKKGMKMANSIHHISYEHTGSELVALLLESAEIKRHKPLFNVAQKRSRMQYGIYATENAQGYIAFSIEPLDYGDFPVVTAYSRDEADRILRAMTDRYKLCQKINGMYGGTSSCFHYQIKECQGACVGKETPEAYNMRAEQAAQHFSYGRPNFFLIDSGRNADERAIVQVEHGKYRGFGFVPVQEKYDVNQLKASILPYEDNKDINKILRGYVKDPKKVERVLYY